LSINYNNGFNAIPWKTTSEASNHDNAKNIKSSKRQRRRLNKMCSDVFFESHMIVPVSKETKVSSTI